MARLNSKLIVQQMPWHANMTEMNHLGKALLVKPEVFENKMTQIFTSVRYSDNPLTKWLSGNSMTDKSISKREWEWKMRGATTKPLVVVENVEPDSNATPGKFRSDFKIKLEEDWFIPGDVINPGTSNKKYQCRIQQQPQQHGKGFIYTVRLMSDDPQLFLPVQYLQPGQAWSKLYSQYEEGAEQSGSTQYSMPFMLQNRMSRYRKKYRVTGDVAQEVLAVKMMGSNGKWFDSWIKYAEVEYWEQWYRELERGMWYSRSTDTVKGATGRSVISGPGVQELLEDSHQHFYTTLTAKLIEEFLMDVFYSRVSPGKDRQLKGYTGEYGMILFHRAMTDVLQKKGFTILDSNFVEKASSNYHTNALSIGYQFTKFKMPNGAVLEMIHNPLYDDREINYEIDPVSGYPMESQRITFLDFGQKESNIALMNRTNSFKLGYVSGLQSPYGVANKDAMAHSGDYYEMHVQKDCGVHIEDVTRCGELILSRAA